MADTVERGDIYFFYRPKVEQEDVEGIEETQRFYMVLMPDAGERARLFLVGRKRLPEIAKGKAKATSREWMMNTSTAAPEKIGEELGPMVYSTKTRGERIQPEAIPAAEGRYALYEKNGSSRLGYRLENPKEPGRALEELGILPTASFVIAVRNPDVEVRGFPQAKPRYPKRLKSKFADERWIDVSDPHLLDYENAQLVLIGAREELEEDDAKITGKPDLFGVLGLNPREWPTDTLEEGVFAAPRMEAEAKSPTGDRTKGGRRGGRAAIRTASAAGIARALKGIDFPRKRAGLVRYARDHRAAQEIVGVLEELPNRRYDNMADVQKALSEVR